MRILIAVALVLAAAAPADAKPRLAVLEIIPSTKTKGYHESLGLAASVLTAKLRTNVMDDAAFAYHSFPRTFDQRGAARVCAPKAPDCWEAILNDAGADYMIYGVVELVGDRIHIIVKLQRGPKVLVASFKPIDMTAKPKELQLVADEIYLKLHGRPVPQTR